MSAIFNQKTDVTPSTTGSWQTVDVSTYVTSDAAFAYLYCENNDTSASRRIAVRPTGAASSAGYSWHGAGMWDNAIIDLDSNKEFECWVDTNTKVYLVGEFNIESENGHTTQHNPTANGWNTISVSGDGYTNTAKAVLVSVTNTHASNTRLIGLRKNGNSDGFTYNLHQLATAYFIIDVDGSEQYQLYAGNYNNVVSYCIGIIHNDNKISFMSTHDALTGPSSTDTWTDISGWSKSGTNCIARVIGAKCVLTNDLALRDESGGIESIYGGPRSIGSQLIWPADASGNVEAKVSNTSTVNLFEVAAFYEGDTDITVTGDTITLAETDFTIDAQVDSDITVTADSISLAEGTFSVDAQVDSDITVISDTIILTESSFTVDAHVDTDVTIISDNIVLTENNFTVEAKIDTDVTLIADTIVLAESNFTIDAQVDNDIILSPDSITLSETDFTVKAYVDVDITVVPDTIIITESNFTVEVVTTTEITLVPDSIVLVESNFVVAADIDSDIVLSPDNIILAASPFTVDAHIDSDIIVTPDAIILSEGTFTVEIVSGTNITLLEDTISIVPTDFTVVADIDTDVILNPASIIITEGVFSVEAVVPENYFDGNHPYLLNWSYGAVAMYYGNSGYRILYPTN